MEDFALKEYLNSEHSKTLTFEQWKAKVNSKRKKIIQMTLEGVFIKEFDTITEAAAETGCNRRAISFVALGRHGRKQTGGFKWKFKD